MGRNSGTRGSLTSFRRRTRFPLFLMLPLSFKCNYDGMKVLNKAQIVQSFQQRFCVTLLMKGFQTS